MAFTRVMDAPDFSNDRLDEAVNMCVNQSLMDFAWLIKLNAINVGRVD